MKKEQFRTMIKEIIKEVIEEISTPDVEDEEHDEADQPIDMSDVPAPTNKTDKRWRGKMRMLQKIHNEPEFKEKLKRIRQQKGDEPLSHKTTTNRGED